MPRRRQRGLALLSVLWVSALLATLAAGFASDTRTESRLARNLRENAKAEALADAGVHHAALHLFRLPADRPWRELATRYRLELGAGEVTVAFEDENAKVDLNYAPPALIDGLIMALGAEPELAATSAARIQDFRDPDQEPLPLGAEDEAYLAAGFEQGAKDAPFIALNELLLVLGMSEELYLRLLPHVTVWSGGEGVDPLRAAPEVLRAIPGIDEETVETILGLGPDEDPYTVLDEERLFEIETFFQFSNESVFRVISVGRSEHGGVFVRDAVIELSGGEERPFLVLE
ncbi:MAG: type II secretion system protein GspK, partial [Geminicoccaceae bacterium]|nr:type II secretion system protein GspK [Geminicoccaceae bacterium]